MSMVVSVVEETEKLDGLTEISGELVVKEIMTELEGVVVRDRV